MIAGPARGPHVLMWAAAVAAVGVAAALLSWGWGSGAWSAAAGVLLIGCVAACAWAVAVGRQSERDVRDAVARLEALRRRAEPSRHDSSSTGGNR